MAERWSLSEQLREQRVEAVVSEVERAALRLFEERGFADVTVDDISAESGISVRTFYRYFPTKEDILQVRIRRSAELLKAALEDRPLDETPLHSVRVAFEELVAKEDADHVGRWIRVIASTPAVLAGVIGGIQLMSNAVMRDFFAARLDLPGDALAPWIWAAAAGGAIQGAHIHWYLHGGDLAQILSDGLEVLERGMHCDGRAIPSD